MQVNKITNTKRSGILTIAVAVMLCATVLTGHIISGTLAKYVSKGGGSDSARVASFSVAASGDSTELSLNYGGTVTYTVTLNNSSEVAVNSTVSITFATDVSDYLTASIRLPAGTADIPGTLSADGRTFTWTEVCALNPAQIDVNLTLKLTTVTALPGQLSGTTGEAYSGRFPFETNVKFIQID